jgi:hypothetical protein
MRGPNPIPLSARQFGAKRTNPWTCGREGLQTLDILRNSRLLPRDRRAMSGKGETGFPPDIA